MKRLLLLFFLIQWSSGSIAQSFIYLKKVGGNFERRIYINDTIRFKLKGDDYFTRGGIELLTDSSFYVYNTEVLLKDIEAVDVNRGFLGMKVLIAGLLLPAIDIMNQSYPPSEEILKISGGLIGVAVLLAIFRKRYFKPDKKNHKMKIILDKD